LLFSSQARWFLGTAVSRLRRCSRARAPISVLWGHYVDRITDNAALTISLLVPGLSDEFKVAIVAGAVTGGGLTVIANAPNPAGVAILKGKFDEGVVSAGKLLLAAIPPTILAAMAFRLL
jgi:predicted cation transporter